MTAQPTRLHDGALHSRVRHTAVVIRGGAATEVDVIELVPGDVVRLTLGQVVPADLRLLECTAFACDESVLTGESAPAEKSPEPVAAGAALAELTSCALMGTVVHGGSATGVVVATGGRAEFGRIALGLGERQPETDFQAGLRRFSMLLLKVAAALTSGIFVINLLLHRPLLDALLFSLAIAVGITPQLLPAVVSTGLATGSRQLARRKVLVKRLVCIEDLGDMDVLVTDKTGTLTEGRIRFEAALDPVGALSDTVLKLGLLATEGDLDQVGGNALDVALWQATGTPPPAGHHRLALLPFDHDRQLGSALVERPDGSRLLVAKGSPEAILARCGDVPDDAAAVLQEYFAAGSRVVAVATSRTSLLRPAPEAAGAGPGPVVACPFRVDAPPGREVGAVRPLPWPGTPGDAGYTAGRLVAERSHRTTPKALRTGPGQSPAPPTYYGASRGNDAVLILRSSTMKVLIFLLVIAILLALVVLAMAIKIVKQYEQGVLFRFGRLVGSREPGLRVIVPVVEVLHRVSLRIVTMPIQSQGIITRDNVSVDVSAVAYFRVVDAVKSVIAIENVHTAINQIAQTTLRKVVGQHTLDETLSETDRINLGIREILDVTTAEWGVEVTLVELKDIQLPDSMKRAMARQAEAEREKRAKIINAEGESLAAAALGDASDIMMNHPLALQLRNLQSLVEIGVDKNTTVVFPAPLMSTIGELGSFLARETAAAGTVTVPPSVDDTRTEPAPVLNGATKTV